MCPSEKAANRIGLIVRCLYHLGYTSVGGGGWIRTNNLLVGPGRPGTIQSRSPESNQGAGAPARSEKIFEVIEDPPRNEKSRRGWAWAASTLTSVVQRAEAVSCLEGFR